MIKEIAEEFEKQSRINTYNLLNNIKDLDYEVLQNKLILEHKNEKEPNKFQRLAKTHPKIYDYCINKLNMGEVLEFININY